MEKSFVKPGRLRFWAVGGRGAIPEELIVHLAFCTAHRAVENVVATLVIVPPPRTSPDHHSQAAILSPMPRVSRHSYPIRHAHTQEQHSLVFLRLGDI